MSPIASRARISLWRLDTPPPLSIELVRAAACGRLAIRSNFAVSSRCTQRGRRRIALNADADADGSGWKAAALHARDGPVISGMHASVPLVSRPPPRGFAFSRKCSGGNCSLRARVKPPAGRGRPRQGMPGYPPRVPLPVRRSCTAILYGDPVFDAPPASDAGDGGVAGGGRIREGWWWCRGR